MPEYQISRVADGLEVMVGEPARAVAQKQPPPASPAAEAAVEPEATRIAGAPKLVPVRAVDLRTIENRTEVLVALDRAVLFEVSRPDPTTAVLTLHGAALPDRLERNLDATALGGPVTMLSSYRAPAAPGDVKIVASTRSGVPDNVEAASGALTWKFGATQQTSHAQQAAQPAARAAADRSRAPAQPDDRDHHGRRVALNVTDIDIKNVPGASAEISKKNRIVADDV